MARFRLFKSLLIFGIFQAISNLSFMILAMVGKNYPLMIFTIAFKNLAGGMGTAAFVAFLMAFCDHRFTAPNLLYSLPWHHWEGFLLVQFQVSW
ncbi:MAG: hypothetical protein CM1200mP16_03150 [Nitrospina sp.]|nr:MAG: hypothetical protein CM1200mP16_03150 [Nitrospina sp.]